LIFLILILSPGDFEMLAGNLASIGVGAIIATASSYMVRSADMSACRLGFPETFYFIFQWPENYDFESTRAINQPTAAPAKIEEKETNEKEERPSVEKKEKEKTPSVADSFDAEEIEDELDPVALNKAFRFAAWSSLALVSQFIPLIFGTH
jgi:hypothetical protein